MQRRFAIPILISVFISGMFLLATSLWGEPAIPPFWFFVFIPLFIVYVLFFIISAFSQHFIQWRNPATSAFLILFGMFLITFSRFPDLTSTLSLHWDVNVAAMGL